MYNNKIKTKPHTQTNKQTNKYLVSKLMAIFHTMYFIFQLSVFIASLA